VNATRLEWALVAAMALAGTVGALVAYGVRLAQ
jgi:hypothetical protein